MLHHFFHQLKIKMASEFEDGVTGTRTTSSFCFFTFVVFEWCLHCRAPTNKAAISASTEVHTARTTTSDAVSSSSSMHIIYCVNSSTPQHLSWRQRKTKHTEDNHHNFSWWIWRAQEPDSSLCGCRKHWFFFLCLLLQVAMHSHHHKLYQLRGMQRQEYQTYHLNHRKQLVYMLINLILQNQHSTYSHSARYDLTHWYATTLSTKASHCVSTSFYWWL